MADDVKVKFGGDFTDVAKGAGDAVNKAGTALNSWFGDFKKSTEASILSSLALSNIFSNFVKGASEALQYFREMDLSLKRFGGSGDAEFQKLAKYGKEVGVSMETVSRTTNYFNKVRTEAAKGNQNYVAILKQFGFTQKEIAAGNISAIEVLGRLADAYDKTGYEGLVGERAMNAFGIRGKELTAIFKNGREAMEEFAKSTATMSRESIEKLSNTQKQIERFKKSLEVIFYQKPLQFGGFVQSAIEATSIVSGATANAVSAGGTKEQQAKTAFNYVKSEFGDNISGLKTAMEAAETEFTALDRRLFTSSERQDVARDLFDMLNKEITRLQTAPKEEKKTALDIPLVKELLTSSSLQAIGGGDISSVLSGTIQANMLTAMQETAANTGKIAAGTDAPKVTPSNVAK